LFAETGEDNLKVSVLIPTNREDTETYAGKVAASLQNCPYEMEILVCSPKNYHIPNTIWVEDKINEGPVAAYRQAYQVSSGDVIQCLVDDHTARDGWWQTADTVYNTNQPCIGSLDWGPIAPFFPTLRRDIIESDYFGGYIFNPAYFHQQADNDLGMHCQFHGLTKINNSKLTMFSAENPQIESVQEYNRFMGPFNDAMFIFFWGKQPCCWNPHISLDLHAIQLMGERLRHPECIRRMKRYIGAV
jgi:hypothetical protein